MNAIFIKSNEYKAQVEASVSKGVVPAAKITVDELKRRGEVYQLFLNYAYVDSLGLYVTLMDELDIHVTLLKEGFSEPQAKDLEAAAKHIANRLERMHQNRMMLLAPLQALGKDLPESFRDSLNANFWIEEQIKTMADALTEHVRQNLAAKEFKQWQNSMSAQSMFRAQRL